MTASETDFDMIWMGEGSCVLCLFMMKAYTASSYSFLLAAAYLETSSIKLVFGFYPNTG